MDRRDFLVLAVLPLAAGSPLCRYRNLACEIADQHYSLGDEGWRYMTICSARRYFVTDKIITAREMRERCFGGKEA